MTTFISICCRLMFMPISSRLPSIRIMSFIICIPSKYFKGSSGEMSCLMPSPSHGDDETNNRNRHYIFTITGNHVHFSARPTHPEIGRRASVNDSNSYFITCFELRGICFRLSVRQELVVVYIADIHRQHAFPFVAHFGLKAAGCNGIGITLNRSFLNRCFLDGRPVVRHVQPAMYFKRFHICPVAENNCVFRHFRFILPMNNECSVHSALFLQTGM